jgi:hypothetical protein
VLRLAMAGYLTRSMTATREGSGSANNRLAGLNASPVCKVLMRVLLIRGVFGSGLVGRFGLCGCSLLAGAGGNRPFCRYFLSRAVSNTLACKAAVASWPA